MLQINVDPSGLTQEQREAVCGFIMAYPSYDLTPKQKTFVDAIAKVAKIPASVLIGSGVTVKHNPSATNTSPAVDPIADLAREGGESDAAAAFGALTPQADDPAAAFGAPAAQVPPAPFASSPMAASATVTPAVSVASTASSVVDVDSAGLPWDARIHASTKSKNKDGTWTAKRGLDKTIVPGVEAELRALMAAPSAAPLAVQASAQPAYVPPVPQAAPVPTAAVTATSGTVPAVATGGAPVDPEAGRKAFVALMGRCSAAMLAGKITEAEITTYCQNFGVPGLPLLANRLDLVDAVAASLDFLITSRG